MNSLILLFCIHFLTDIAAIISMGIADRKA